MKTEGKTSFLVHDKHKRLLDKLTYEQKGIVFEALFCHHAGEPLPVMDIATEMVFEAMAIEMDIDCEKYAERCEKNRLAGAKGGRAKVANVANAKASVANVANATNATNATSVVANVADNDSDYDSDSDGDSDNDMTFKGKRVPLKKSTKRKTHLTVEEEQTLITERAIPASVAVILDQWCVYKEEKGERYTPTGFKSLLTKVEGYIRDFGEQATIDGIEQSMASGWKGIFVKEKASDGYSAIAAFVAGDDGDLPFG